MKQLMVLVATIILGVSISGVVLSFDENVETMGGYVSTGVGGVVENMAGKLDIEVPDTPTAG